MTQDRIQIGVIGRPHGVRGLVRVHCDATDPAALAGYGVLTDDRGQGWTLVWRGDGIAELRDASGKALGDRDAAQALVNRKLYVARDALPEPEEDEFYHSDLVGMEAVEAGHVLGRVTLVHDYGAGASIELDNGLIVPFNRVCVPHVDLAARRLTVVRPEEVIGEDQSQAGRRQDLDEELSA